MAMFAIQQIKREIERLSHQTLRQKEELKLRAVRAGITLTEQKNEAVALKMLWDPAATIYGCAIVLTTCCFIYHEHMNELDTNTELIPGDYIVCDKDSFRSIRSFGSIRYFVLLFGISFQLVHRWSASVDLSSLSERLDVHLIRLCIRTDLLQGPDDQWIRSAVDGTVRTRPTAITTGCLGHVTYQHGPVG